MLVIEVVVLWKAASRLKSFQSGLFRARLSREAHLLLQLSILLLQQFDQSALLVLQGVDVVFHCFIFGGLLAVKLAQLSSLCLLRQQLLQGHVLICVLPILVSKHLEHFVCGLVFIGAEIRTAKVWQGLVIFKRYVSVERGISVDSA